MFGNVWCAVFGVWHLMLGVWCLMFGVWCSVFGTLPMRRAIPTTQKNITIKMGMTNINIDMIKDSAGKYRGQESHRRRT